jgi:hypothetical protein
MKALIVDHEGRARNKPKRLLKAHPEVEVVGDAPRSTPLFSRKPQTHRPGQGAADRAVVQQRVDGALGGQS